jgi:hypothetical protein
MNNFILKFSFFFLTETILNHFIGLKIILINKIKIKKKRKIF